MKTNVRGKSVMRVLLVEDDYAISQSIETMLKKEGMIVDTTDLGEDGLEIGKLYDYDIIILDLMLPDMNGYEVLKNLRASKVNTPVLILSGLSEPDKKVKGLGYGADNREWYGHSAPSVLRNCCTGLAVP